MTGALLEQLPFLIILSAVAIILKRFQNDRISTLLFLAALLLMHFHIQQSSWRDYTIDATAHLDYVRFILEHGRLPVSADYTGAAARHPPAYYLMGAAALKLGQSLGLEAPEQYVRYVSLALYTLFLFLGMRMLQVLLSTSPTAYYGALATLLFWPVGITFSGRVTCDLLLLAGQAGALLSIIRWIVYRQPQHVALAFFWCGIAVSGKNGGFIMMGFAGLALLGALVHYRRTPATLLLRWDIPASLLFSLTCCYLSFRHGWIMEHVNEYGVHYFWDFFWHYIDSFNVFVFLYDTQLGLSQESFWNMWLHTLLLGSSSIAWKFPVLMIAHKILWTAMLLYGLEALLQCGRKLLPQEKLSLLLLGCFTLLMTFAAMLLLVRTANINYADARYAYPIVLLLALVHGFAMKGHAQGKRLRALQVGALLATAFAGLTVALILMQHLL